MNGNLLVLNYHSPELNQGFDGDHQEDEDNEDIEGDNEEEKLLKKPRTKKTASLGELAMQLAAAAAVAAGRGRGVAPGQGVSSSWSRSSY